jgi:hypothetical protein
MTNRQEAFPNYLRPVIPQIKWWIASSILLLLGAWQLAVHRWLMGLPMATGHQVSALLGSAIVGLAVLAFLTLIQGYEDRMAAGSKILWELDQDLRRQVSERNTSFYQAARELEEVSKEIARECEEALRDPASADLARALSTVKNRSEAVGRLACALDRLVDEGDHLTNLLPRALKSYRCHCAAAPDAVAPAAPAREMP